MSRAAQQHHDRVDTRVDRAILALLVADGVAVGLLSVFFLPWTAGGMPVILGPVITAAVAGAVNLLLARAAVARTTRTALAALPLVAWLLVYLVFLTVSVGGNMMMPGDGRSGLLLVLGAGPAGFWLIGRAVTNPASAAPAARPATR